MPFSADSFDLSCLLHKFTLQIALQKAMHFGGKYIPYVVSASLSTDQWQWR